MELFSQREELEKCLRRNRYVKGNRLQRLVLVIVARQTVVWIEVLNERVVKDRYVLDDHWIMWQWSVAVFSHRRKLNAILVYTRMTV